MIVVPSLISLLGLGLGFAGLEHRSIFLLMLSLCCDVADGECARRLGCVTKAGAALDFAIDTTLGGALAWMAWPPLVLISIGWQTYSRGRFSGRTVMTLIFCATLLR